MIAVDLLGLDPKTAEEVKLGTLLLEDGVVRCEPEGSQFLNSVMGKRIRGADGEALTAQDDPDEWMVALHTHYRGAYLRATKAREME